MLEIAVLVQLSLVQEAVALCPPIRRLANSLLKMRIRLSSKAQHSSRRTRGLPIGEYVVDRATPRACGSWFAAELSCCVSVGRFSYVASLVQRSGRRSGSPCLAPPRFFLTRQSYAVPSCPS